MAVRRTFESPLDRPAGTAAPYLPPQAIDFRPRYVAQNKGQGNSALALLPPAAHQEAAQPISGAAADLSHAEYGGSVLLSSGRSADAILGRQTAEHRVPGSSSAQVRYSPFGAALVIHVRLRQCNAAPEYVGILRQGLLAGAALLVDSTLSMFPAGPGICTR